MLRAALMGEGASSSSDSNQTQTGRLATGPGGVACGMFAAHGSGHSHARFPWTAAQPGHSSHGASRNPHKSGKSPLATLNQEEWQAVQMQLHDMQRQLQAWRDDESCIRQEAETQHAMLQSPSCSAPGIQRDASMSASMYPRNRTHHAFSSAGPFDYQ